MYFIRLQEAPGRLLCDLFGEVDHKDISEETDTDSHDAFEDEDPSPAVVACSASLTVLESVIVGSATVDVSLTICWMPNASTPERPLHRVPMR